ncbi:putative phosphopantothenoylcysteine decarboxylase [Rosellinia necatrix]|uniref:Putative phosphopantothenoylcysteine decarboxylase n=1 Tax=Rosellinia necatrix TaxID=77044 RepID=A0A1S8A5X7_ROSNE|nr:putative phosphopantothenoylcysteine decarboxylase [Rosellinia necatrix]
MSGKYRGYANTLAKISGGFADSLLTSVVRAWDPRGELDGTSNPNRRVKKRRIIVAPAMNTAMWRHPITAKQLRVLEEEWGVRDKLPAAAADDGSAPESPPASQEVIDDGYGYGYGYGGDGDGDDGNYDGWFEVLRPQSKVLACGDAGDGAMIEWTQIVAIIEDRLGLGHAAAA